MGGDIGGGVVGGDGVGMEGPIGDEEIGPAVGWIFGDVVRFDKKNVQWQASGLTEESVAWL